MRVLAKDRAELIEALVAIDDESSLWTADERRGHLVATNGCRGLMEPAAQDRLTTVLLGQLRPRNAQGA